MEIIPIYFILTLLISFLVLYLFAPDPKIIIKYPNMNSDVSDMYVDDNNVCYQYHKTKVNCTK